MAYMNMSQMVADKAGAHTNVETDTAAKSFKKLPKPSLEFTPVLEAAMAGSLCQAQRGDHA